MQLDTNRIKQDFSRAAAEYTRHAELQRSILGELCRRAAPMQIPGHRILDIGCGPGWAIDAMAGDTSLIGLDIAEPMCREARARGVPSVCADARNIPIATASMDGVLSSLCVQWIDRPSAFLCEAYRVLKPGGYLAVATLGPSTLHELNESFAACGETGRVITFQPQEVWQEEANKAGFRLDHVESMEYPQSYEGFFHLLRTLRGIGASNKRHDRKRGMTGRGVLAKVEAYYTSHYRLPGGGIHASWQPIFLIGRKD